MIQSFALSSRHLDSVAFHAASRPDAPACRDLESGADYSYAALDRRVARCAAWLATGTEGQGARVSVLSRNHLDVIVLFLACGRAGRTFHPLNFRLAEAELHAILTDAGSGLLIFDEPSRVTAEALQRRAPGLQLVPIDDVGGLLDRHAPAPPEPVDAGSPLALLYTSGTSGTPKGAVITHSSAFFSAANIMLAIGTSSESVVLCDIPLFHVLALLALVRTTFLAGGSLLVSRGFDADRTFSRLTEPALGVTHYFCVPQIAQMLWKKVGNAGAAASGFPRLITGGAPLTPAAVRDWAGSGVVIANGYGMTEAGSVFQMPPGGLDLLARKAGSVGVGLFSTETRLVRADGSQAAADEVGELWLRGPSLCAGYWNKPDETHKAFTPDGWFKTGDMARFDEDGFWWIVDRKKDMFISGGENVYSAEVEAAVAELAGVAETAIIGVSDPKWGEVGCAYVIVHPGSAVDADLVIAHCQARLARYKVPKHVILADELPRTASGKVQKQLLLAHWRSRGGVDG